MFNLKASIILKQNLNWIVIAVLFFGAGIAATALLVGDAHPLLEELTASQQNVLEELAELVFGGSPLRGIIFLFVNNLLVSLQMMLLGIVIGIPRCWDCSPTALF